MGSRESNSRGRKKLGMNQLIPKTCVSLECYKGWLRENFRQVGISFDDMEVFLDDISHRQIVRMINDRQNRTFILGNPPSSLILQSCLIKSTLTRLTHCGSASL